MRVGRGNIKERTELCFDQMSCNIVTVMKSSLKRGYIITKKNTDMACCDSVDCLVKEYRYKRIGLQYGT